MMYDFADLIFVVNGTLGALSILAAIFCCVGTTIYCCYAELVNVPAELIRPKSPALGKRILLEYVPLYGIASNSCTRSACAIFSATKSVSL